MNKLCVIASLSLLVIAGATWADDKLPANDKEFLMQAITCGHAEVKYSELAEKRAANERVKEFAAMMIKDHSDANNKLAELAKTQKLAVAAGFERDKRDTYMNLSKLSGAEFDKAYMRQMVTDHENAVKMLEHQAKNGMDPELKKFAEDTLKKVQDHLKAAKDIHGTLEKGN